MAYNSALQNKLSFAVFGFRKTIEDGTMKNRVLYSNLFESEKDSIF